MGLPYSVPIDVYQEICPLATNTVVNGYDVKFCVWPLGPQPEPSYAILTDPETYLVATPDEFNEAFPPKPDITTTSSILKTSSTTTTTSETPFVTPFMEMDFNIDGVEVRLSKPNKYPKAEFSDKAKIREMIRDRELSWNAIQEMNEDRFL